MCMHHIIHYNIAYNYKALETNQIPVYRIAEKIAVLCNLNKEKKDFIHKINILCKNIK